MFKVKSEYKEQAKKMLRNFESVTALIQPDMVGALIKSYEAKLGKPGSVRVALNYVKMFATSDRDERNRIRRLFKKLLGKLPRRWFPRSKTPKSESQKKKDEEFLEKFNLIIDLNEKLLDWHNNFTPRDEEEERIRDPKELASKRLATIAYTRIVDRAGQEKKQQKRIPIGGQRSSGMPSNFEVAHMTAIRIGVNPGGMADIMRDAEKKYRERHDLN